MKRLVLKILIGLALSTGLFVCIYYFWVLDPWTSYPDTPKAEIEARFQSLEQWGWSEAKAANDSKEAKQSFELLTAALEAAEEDLRGIARPSEWTEKPPRVGALSESAVQALLRWSDQSGSLEFERCDDELGVLGLVGVGRAALFLAPENAPYDHAYAVLRMAKQLRIHGNTIQAMAGFELAQELSEWAEKRRVGPTKTIRELAPRAEEVFPLIVREAVCAVESMQAELTAGKKPEPLQGPPETQAPLFAPFSPDREFVVLKLAWVEILEGAYEKRNDLKALSEALNVPIDSLPRSPLVRVMISSISRIFMIRPSESIEAYQTMLDELAHLSLSTKSETAEETRGTAASAGTTDGAAEDGHAAAVGDKESLGEKKRRKKRGKKRRRK